MLQRYRLYDGENRVDHGERPQRRRIDRQSMGLVTDDQGLVTGLVTTGDILNQIVEEGTLTA